MKLHHQYSIVAAASALAAMILLATSIPEAIDVMKQHSSIGRLILGVTMLFSALSMHARGMTIRAAGRPKSLEKTHD